MTKGLAAAFLFIFTASFVLAYGIPETKLRALEQLHQKAEEYILKNDFKAAIRVYDDIVLSEPDDETAYTGLGQCYLVLGDYPRAKNAYLNALHINPDNETALLGMKKIENPDSMNFTDEYTVTVPETKTESPAPPQAVNPIPVKTLSREQKIQTALKKTGFYRGSIDGILGPMSRNAVMGFQKKNGLAETGKVDEATWKLLQASLKNPGA